jgi:4'-phosphopantetheinyl transferase
MSLTAPPLAAAGWTPVAEPVPLGANEVHCYAARLDAGTDQTGLLAPGERVRAGRFVRPEDARRWSAAHVLLRLVLARHAGARPEELRFWSPTRDKPVLRRPRRARSLRFNLAHSGDLAVVAVSRDLDVGVDVEAVRPGRDFVAVADRVLGPAVAAELRALPDGARTERFFRAWVHHEARGKCLGTGIVERHEDPRTPVVTLDLDVMPGYVGALATAAPPGRVRRWYTAV